MKRKVISWILILTICLTFTGELNLSTFAAGFDTVAGTPFAEQQAEFVPDEVLFQTDSYQKAEKYAEVYDAELISYSEYGGIAVLRVPDAKQAVAQKKPFWIPKLSLNYTYKTAVVEETPKTEKERAVRLAQAAAETETVRRAGAPSDPDYDLQLHHQLLGTEQAWEVTKGSKDVVVAVIDTGIDIDHPEFKGRISEKSYNSHFDTVGKDFVRDDNGHGTHVSGIIAAGQNNGHGGSGIAPNVTIMAIKANIPGGDAFSNDSIARAIYYATDNGAKIINMSLGSPCEVDEETDVERAAIRYAVSKGVTVICAAGNDADRVLNYPAVYPESIAVSALNMDGSFAFDYSNFGAEVDIAAPGTDILSTIPGGDYAYFTGTSMATPVVAGVAALILSVNPNYTPEQIRTALSKSTVDGSFFGTDEFYGAGMVNAGKAVGQEVQLLEITYRDHNDKKINTAEIGKGGTILKTWPEHRNGYTFMGWYTDATRTKAYDYNTTVTKALTLYAKWEKGEKEAPAEDFLLYYIGEVPGSILRYIGFSAVVIVPSQYEDTEITEIRDRAFCGREYIQKVVIPDTVETIGAYAFAHNRNMDTLVLPESVLITGIGMMDNTKWYGNQPDGMIYLNKIAYEYKGEIPEEVTIKAGTKAIGAAAVTNRGYASVWNETSFEQSSLKRVTLPDSVEYIGESAFRGSQLTDITFPDSVNTLAAQAFQGNEKLTSIHIPAGLEEISIGVFDHCISLETITVAAENTAYTAAENVLYSKDKKLLLQYPLANKTTAYAVPEGVVTIALWAFSGAPHIESVSFPASLRIIGGGAFFNCPELKSAVVPSTVGFVADSCPPTLGPSEDSLVYYFSREESFQECHPDFVLKCYRFSAAYEFALEFEIPYEIIGTERSDPNYNKDYLTFSDNMLCVWPISKQYTSIVLPEGVGVIRKNAFTGQSKLKSVILPDGLQHIGRDAFFACDNLKSISIPESVTYIGDGAFNSCVSLTRVDFPESVTYFGSETTFYWCASLTSVKLPEGTTSIGREAFSQCAKLGEVIIPETVKSIGKYAFANCTSLKSITIPKEVTEIDDEAFWVDNAPAISCYSGSAAHTYATENSITVKLLDAYTVKFNKNGGSGTMKNQSHIVDKSTKLTANTFTRKGYVFAGWNTRKDGSGTKYTNKKSVKNLAKAGKSVTLYAQWTKVSAPTKAVTGLKLTSPKTKQLKVTYKAVSGAAGYRIEYSTSKTFTKATTKSVHTTKLTCTIKSLKAKTTYYVRVTAYKTDSTNAKIYSKKTAVKNLKTK